MARLVAHGLVLACVTCRQACGQEFEPPLGHAFPTLEAVASGRLKPPSGLEGSAVGTFPHLASPRRAAPGIYAKRDSGASSEADSPPCDDGSAYRGQCARRNDVQFTTRVGGHQEKYLKQHYEQQQYQQQYQQQDRQGQQQERHPQQYQQSPPTHAQGGVATAATHGRAQGRPEEEGRVNVRGMDASVVAQEIEALRRLVGPSRGALPGTPAADGAAALVGAEAAPLAKDPAAHAELAQKLQALDLARHSGGALSREALGHYRAALALEEEALEEEALEEEALEEEALEEEALEEEALGEDGAAPKRETAATSGAALSTAPEGLLKEQGGASVAGLTKKGSSSSASAGRGGRRVLRDDPNLLLNLGHLHAFLGDSNEVGRRGAGGEGLAIDAGLVKEATMMKGGNRFKAGEVRT